MMGSGEGWKARLLRLAGVEAMLVKGLGTMRGGGEVWGLRFWSNLEVAIEAVLPSRVT